jgi:hypothetical protein
MNTIQDLREAIFQTIEGVRNKTVPVENATVIGNLGQVIINSAKVEVELVKATQGKVKGTGFMGEVLDAAPVPGKPALPSGITGVTTHRIGDQEPEAA